MILKILLIFTFSARNMKARLFATFILCLMFLFPASGQTKTQIVDDHIAAFNKRDIEGFIKPMSDSVKLIAFPDIITEKSKKEVRKNYAAAFDSKELGGQMIILGKLEIGNVYIVEESLQRDGLEPVTQYILFRFSGDKIIEIHYLPKNFSWPNTRFDRR